MEYLKSLKFSEFIFSLINRLNIERNSCYVYSYWNDYMAASISKLKTICPEIKGFTRAHGWDVYCERHPMHYLPLRKYIAKNLDMIFFISKNGREYYNNMLPDYSYKFNYSALGTIRLNKTAEYFQKDYLNILSVSSIIPLKNLWMIIDSLSLIKNIEIHWNHFGVGSEEEAIKLYAKEKFKNNYNIKYDFKGFVYNTKIHEYYSMNQVDLFINSSTTEGIPVSIMEAMSFGIPVIAPSVGGIPEIVYNKENGFLLAQSPKPHDFANVIKEFYNYPLEKKLQLRKCAFQTWENNYNANKNYKTFINQILKL